MLTMADKGGKGRSGCPPVFADIICVHLMGLFTKQIVYLIFISFFFFAVTVYKVDMVPLLLPNHNLAQAS